MYCKELHQIFSNLPRFRHPYNVGNIPTNGIYIMFEKGERDGNMDRVVRVGTHVGQNNLRNRLNEHYIKENADRSIFRKNIGRAILNKRTDPYLEIWEYDFTMRSIKQQYEHLRDLDYEMQVESEVTEYIQSNITFTVFEVIDKPERLRLETAIIASLAQDAGFHPSEQWFGRWSPISEIKGSGLWQTQHLNGESLSKDELEYLKDITTKV